MSLIRKDIRANLGKICEIKVNKKNRTWVCTKTVLVFVYNETSIMFLQFA